MRTDNMYRCVFRLCLLSSAAFCLASTGSSQTVEEPAPAKLTSEQRQEINVIVAKYRRARADAEERSAVVDEAFAYGPPAVSAVLTVIEKDLRPQLARYRSKFMQQAAGIYKTRVTGENIEEIMKLRETALGLRKRGDGFTKQAIKAEGDPALARLRELILAGRDEVLEGADALKAQRQRISDVGELWQKCSEYLLEQEPVVTSGAKESPSFEKYLAGEEELAAGLAAPMSPKCRSVLAMNAQLAQRIDPEEARAIEALNLTRSLLGLLPVTIDLRLCAAARDHSNDMKTLKFFSHTSKVPDKASFTTRAKRFGTSASAENIYSGGKNGYAANGGWWHSPGHHANMLAGHKRVGVGRAGGYFTQMFGG